MLKAPVPLDRFPKGVLIDRRGRVWAHGPEELASRLRFAASKEDFASLAVRERGFVHLVRRADGIHVRLAHKKFTQRSLLGALLTLENYPARILLSIHDGADWSHRMFTDLGSFAEFAENVAADRPYGSRGRPTLAAGPELATGEDEPPAQESTPRHQAP
jgi:hypothetical protein